jgi:TonB family protein
MSQRDVARVFVAVCCLWPLILSADNGRAVSGAQRIDPPRRLKHVEPTYPDDARRARVQGQVVVRATIGPDGKVSSARVLRSVPALDQAALEAVRQWEYAPTIVDGVATSVTATVIVNFELSRPPDDGAPGAAATGQATSQSPGAVASSGPNAEAWHGVVDQALQLKAEGKLPEAAARLEKYVAGNPGAWPPYVTLALILREQGRLDAAADVLRKARTLTSGLPPMHALQFAQYLVEQVTESPKITRANAGRLLDEARAVLDELIESRQEVRMAMMAKSLALKVQAERVEQSSERRKTLLAESDRLFEEARFVNADGSAIAKTVHDEWRDVQSMAFVGADDGKSREAVSIIEEFVAKHPDFAPAHLALGRHYEGLARAITDRGAKSVETRTRHLELAGKHFRRAADLATEPDAIFALWGLIDTLKAGNLNRPAEAEALARSAVAKYPHEPSLVMQLLEILLPSAQIAAADGALRRAREAVPPTAEARVAFGMVLWERVSRSPQPLPRETSQALLAEAITALDGALTLKPDDVNGTLYKGIVLRLQAERVEQDPARAKALLVEADRLRERAEKLQKRENVKP